MDPATAARSASDQGPVQRPDDHVIVMFGASGDLAKRKLLPGLFHLAAAGLLPEHYRIIGSSRAKSALTDEQFREHAKQAVDQFGITKSSSPAWAAFEKSLSYAAAEASDTTPLADAIQRAEKEIGGSPRRLFHLAVPPGAFASVVTMIGAAGLAGPRSGIIIEKPFGTDLASAKALNETVHGVFDESQVFRIDHFLGKESVDNILALRFANGLLEPVWNRMHVSYVQIDVPETLSIEGRGEFYDSTGAFRDMVVTHLFQVLAFVAMEPPNSLGAQQLREEKGKVFDGLQPIDVSQVVRGQYDGYRDQPGVAPDSQTETMVAVRAWIDNERWSGVPFFLRSGKSLGASRQVVTLGFHEPPLRMFQSDRPGLPMTVRDDVPDGYRNEIVIDFADPGSITAEFLAKEPGLGLTLAPAQMVFRYADSFNSAHALEGYERLILDAMFRDQALFTRSDNIERLWEISVPLLEHPPPVQPYAQGSWGPLPATDELLAPFTWHLPGHDARPA